jgi:tartrate/fumarate subfamily iron-sulfur-dependent hydro-lyase alpha chain
MNYATIIISLLGGLAIFLYSMQMMSSGLEATAGNKMKKILEKLTSNRVVGVGVGGTFDKAAFLAKKALIRAADQRNPDPFWATLEQELLQQINALGIGPQGFGGKTTALCVNIEQYPAHIASLPVAVNLNCHVCRHKTEVL